MYQVIQKDPALVLQGPQGLLRLYPVNENAVTTASATASSDMRIFFIFFLLLLIMAQKN